MGISVQCDCGKQFLMSNDSASTPVICPFCGRQVHSFFSNESHVAMNLGDSFSEPPNPDIAIQNPDKNSLAHTPSNPKLLRTGRSKVEHSRRSHFPLIVLSVSVLCLLLSIFLIVTSTSSKDELNATKNSTFNPAQVAQVTPVFHRPPIQVVPPSPNPIDREEEKRQRQVMERERQRQEALRRKEERIRNRIAELERRRKEIEKLNRALDEASKQVISKGPALLKVAHPIAKFDGIELKNVKSIIGGGNKMIFDVQYITGFLKATCWLEVHITLDANNKFKEITWGRDTGIIPPGAAVAIAADILEELLNK